MDAWMQKKPKDSSATNGERFDVHLPEIDQSVAHIPEILIELGTVMQGGMSASSLTFAEIESWARSFAFPLTPFEVKALKSMSSAFSSTLSSDSDICPMDDGLVRESIDMVNIQAMIAMAQSND